MTTIVIVSNPVFYQKETSVAHEGYIVMRRFEINEQTKCSLLNGTVIEAADALEGSLEGWYECRLLTTSHSESRISKYKKDSSTLEMALGLSALIVFGALLVGK